MRRQQSRYSCDSVAFARPRARRALTGLQDLDVAFGRALHRSFFGGRTLPCRQVSPLRNVKWAAILVLALPPKARFFTAAARRRTFAQSAAHRFVASISQESVPSPSEHAMRHHRLRRFAACCARLTPENMLGRRMFQGELLAVPRSLSGSSTPPRRSKSSLASGLARRFRLRPQVRR